MMEIKNLIEILRGKCAVCKRSSCNGHYWELSSCPATWEASTALEQLQAENDRLKETIFCYCDMCIEQDGVLWCQSCDEKCDYCIHPKETSHD